MELFDELRTLGVDIDDGLKRLMGKEDLYQRMLGKFINTLRSQYLPVDFDAADCETAIEKAHSIKGTAGNLSITPLFEGYNEILTLLRAGSIEEARVVLERIIPIQNEIIACIEKHMA